MHRRLAARAGSILISFGSLIGASLANVSDSRDDAADEQVLESLPVDAL